MARLAICPQQHVWSPAVTEQGQHELTCPVCGKIGEPTTPDAQATVLDYESIGADALPPVVPFSTVIPVGRRAAGERTSFDTTVPEIADYEIVRELGRGGMGIVYLARHQTLKRLVALKMIRGDVSADDGALLRFRREAEAVARLQHHGIVQIHDVGTHRGSPYLALEFIDGDNLAQRLQGATMPPRLAAALIESLARTVHYAHQNGIVHRDLTPRNILLARSTSTQGVRLSTADTEASDPKITDFGLAKELDADVQQTQSGVIMGTPSYMSPEQAKGLPQEIGPCTDIHALGAVLYEALTGRPPFLAATQLETLLQVIEQEPVAPTRLQPSVPRDLETICLKCLEKEPRKRYPSADALADDLRRFLANEPIQARPVSLFERAWKLGRRHPARAGLIAVSILAVLTLTIGGIAYNARLRAERDRAERNFELAMEAVDKMLTEVGEEQLAVEPRMEEKRKVLLAEALTLYQGILSQQKDDPRVRFETAQAHRRMGDILRLLGDHEKAIVAYGEARHLLEQLQSESPGDASYLREMAHCDNMQGEALRAVSRSDEAAAAYQRAQSGLESRTDKSPDPAANQELASVLYNSGILRKQSQQLAEAEKEFRRAIDLLLEVSEQTPPTPELQQHLARAYLNLGTVIPAGDRFADAKSAYDRSIEILGTLTQSHRDKPDYQYERAIAFNNLGNLMLRAGRLSDARSAYEQAREGFAALSRDFPKVPLYRQELANSLNSAGSVSSREKDLPQAVKNWSQAATLLEGLVGESPDLATYRGDLGMVLGNLGLAYHSQSQSREARAQLEKAIEHLKHVVKSVSDEDLMRLVLRNNYQNLAEVLLASHEHAAAANAARSLRELFPSNGHDHYVAACYFARCATEAENDSTIATQERPALAQKYADEAVAMLRRAIELGFNDAVEFELDRERALKSLSARSEFQELAAKNPPRRLPTLTETDAAGTLFSPLPIFSRAAPVRTIMIVRSCAPSTVDTDALRGEPDMRLRSAAAVLAAAILISLFPADSIRAQGTTDPVIRDSNVGYIDAAIPGDILRFQFDAAYDINRPTRSEFFWSPGDPNGRGPDIPERSVDYQDLLVGIEKAFGERTSAFVNLPVRFLDPALNPNTAGLVDMNAGFKHALIYNEDLVATFQFRAYAPTGDVDRGLGNGHASLEPALLIYKPLWNGWVAEAEVRDWIPVGGEAFAGNVIRYGTGVHYDGLYCGSWQVVPTAEFIGWTALDGNVTTFDENDQPVIEDATGDTVFNVKVGMRLKYQELGDVYMGYGNAISGDRWYEDTFRIELRLYL